MATTKQTNECNVHPTNAGNVHQSPDRTYLIVKNKYNFTIMSHRELNVNELLNCKKNGGLRTTKTKLFFLFLHLLFSLPQKVLMIIDSPAYTHSWLACPFIRSSRLEGAPQKQGTPMNEKKSFFHTHKEKRPSLLPAVRFRFQPSFYQRFPLWAFLSQLLLYGIYTSLKKDFLPPLPVCYSSTPSTLSEKVRKNISIGLEGFFFLFRSATLKW